jgi:hypothetical protein
MWERACRSRDILNIDHVLQRDEEVDWQWWV